MYVLFGTTHLKHAPLGLADATDADLPEVTPEAPADLPEESVTLFTIPDSDSLIEQVLPTVTKVWAQSHSDGAPIWVASDNEAAAVLFAANYKCPTRDVHEAMTLYQGLDEASMAKRAEALAAEPEGEQEAPAPDTNPIVGG